MDIWDKLCKIDDGLDVKDEREREVLRLFPGLWLFLYRDCILPITDSLGELIWHELSRWLVWLGDL